MATLLFLYHGKQFFSLSTLQKNYFLWYNGNLSSWSMAFVVCVSWQIIFLLQQCQNITFLMGTWQLKFMEHGKCSLWGMSNSFLFRNNGNKLLSLMGQWQFNCMEHGKCSLWSWHFFNIWIHSWKFSLYKAW